MAGPKPLHVHFDSLGETYHITHDLDDTTYVANLPAEKVERFERIQREWDEMQDELWGLHTDSMTEAE